MTNKALETCYDFPFFFPEELAEIFQAHEKKHLSRKVISFLRKEKQPMNIIFLKADWRVPM